MFGTESFCMRDRSLKLLVHVHLECHSSYSFVDVMSVNYDKMCCSEALERRRATARWFCTSSLGPSDERPTRRKIKAAAAATVMATPAERGERREEKYDGNFYPTNDDGMSTNISPTSRYKTLQSSWLRRRFPIASPFYRLKFGDETIWSSLSWRDYCCCCSWRRSIVWHNQFRDSKLCKAPTVAAEKWKCISLALARSHTAGTAHASGCHFRWQRINGRGELERQKKKGCNSQEVKQSYKKASLST